MSVTNLDDVDHQIENEYLLLQILRELRIMNTILNEISGLHLTKDDLDE